MSIGLSFTSVRPQTAHNLVLDSGIVVVDFNLTVFRSTGDFMQAAASTATWTKNTAIGGGSTYPKYLGATRGGTTINMNRTERQVVVDGHRVKYVGLQRIDMVEPSMETTLLEIADLTTAQMQMGSSVATTFTNYTELVPQLIVQNGDYYGNIAILATVSGNSLPKVWVLDNVRVNKNDAQSLKDKDEVAQKVTFDAHAVLTGINVVPYHEFIPNYTGS